MVDVETIASIFIKIFKLVLNLIVLILYRIGNGGKFLGIGGEWNLNEEKTADGEIIASGVFVGYFIYTAVILIAFVFGPTNYFKRGVSDTIMNFVGTFMWVSVGGTGLHYWNGYISDPIYPYITNERDVGLAMSSLCVINAILYLVDTVLAFVHVARH